MRLFTCLVRGLLLVALSLGCNFASQSAHAQSAAQQQRLVKDSLVQLGNLIKADAQASACNRQTVLGKAALEAQIAWHHAVIETVTSFRAPAIAEPTPAPCLSANDKQADVVLQQATFEWIPRVVAMRRFIESPGWAHQIFVFDYDATYGETLWKAKESAIVKMLGVAAVKDFYKDVSNDAQIEAAVICPAHITFNTTKPRNCPSMANISRVQLVLATKKIELEHKFADALRAAQPPVRRPARIPQKKIHTQPSAAAQMAAPPSAPTPTLATTAITTATPAKDYKPAATATTISAPPASASPAPATGLCSEIKRIAETAMELPAFSSITAKDKNQFGQRVGLATLQDYAACTVSLFPSPGPANRYTCRYVTKPARQTQKAAAQLSSKITAELAACFGAAPSAPPPDARMGAGHIAWRFPGTEKRILVHKVDGTDFKSMSLTIAVQNN